MAPPDPMLMKAISVHQAGRIAEAKAMYERILRRHPNDADTLNFLGMLEFQRGGRERGIGLLERSLKSAPANPHAWINIGNMRMGTGAREAAAEAYERATALAPDLWQAWLNRGVCLRHLKRFDEAIECLDTAIRLNPDKDVAYERLGMILYRLGRTRELAKLHADWLEYNPNNPTAQHMYAAASGAPPPDRASDDYVRKTFDSFAETFDENLADLGYRAPQLLATAVSRGLVKSDCRATDVLDAGAGTGLLGLLLRGMTDRLVGVDLSPRMLEKARARKVYNELVCDELCAFMRSRPSAFDVIVSADTLVYFGALEEVFAAASSCLRAGGLLAFTVERWDVTDAAARFHLGAHGRYLHAAAYIRAALEATDLRVMDIQNDVLRTELEVEVAGLVVTATR